MSVELIERDLLLESPAALPLGLASSRDLLGRIGSLETRLGVGNAHLHFDER